MGFDFTVLEMVLMGRSPHKRAMERDNAEDYQIVRDALATVGMAGFEERAFTTRSGGERIQLKTKLTSLEKRCQAS